MYKILSQPKRFSIIAKLANTSERKISWVRIETENSKYHIKDKNEAIFIIATEKPTLVVIKIDESIIIETYCDTTYCEELYFLDEKDNCKN